MMILCLGLGADELEAILKPASLADFGLKPYVWRNFSAAKLYPDISILRQLSGKNGAESAFANGDTATRNELTGIGLGGDSDAHIQPAPQVSARSSCMESIVHSSFFRHGAIFRFD